MGDVFIDGAWQTGFGRDERNLEIIMADAGQKTLDNSRDKEPDLVLVGNYGYQVFFGQASIDALVANELGFGPVFHINRGSASGAAPIELAYKLVKSGLKVLVIGGEKMWSRDVNSETIMNEISKVMDEKERIKFDLKMRIIVGIGTNEYRGKYRIPEEQMRETFFQTLNRNRSHGASNPYAHFKEQLSWDDYFNNPEKNPMVARPLTRNDCAGVYNGAAAVYLVPYETDIKLSGIKSDYSKIETNRRRTLTSMDATIGGAIELYRYVNLNPGEIDIVELHDAFASIPIIASEDLGFAERGKGSEFILHEQNQYGKRVFYNRSGGFLCKTHPLGASGTAQLVELVFQLRGEGQYLKMLEKYQKNINYALWLSINGYGYYNDVGIIEKTNPSVPRKGLKEENLPRYLEISREPFEEYRRRKIIGMTGLEGGDYPAIGVIRTPEGELRLGHIGELDKLQLGKRVDLIEGEDGLCFVPVSNPVRRRLEKILG